MLVCEVMRVLCLTTLFALRTRHHRAFVLAIVLTLAAALLPELEAIVNIYLDYRCRCDGASYLGDISLHLCREIKLLAAT